MTCPYIVGFVDDPLALPEQLEFVYEIVPVGLLDDRNKSGILPTAELKVMTMDTESPPETPKLK